MGACCDPATGDSCSVTTETSCAGTWQGSGTVCSPNPCPAAHHGLLIVTDPTNTSYWTNALQPLGKDITVLTTVPSSLAGYDGVLLSSYAAAEQGGALPALAAYVTAGGSVYMDSGNPACLACGGLGSCALPDWMGAGHMVYSSGTPSSYTVMNDAFCSTVASGTVIHTDTGTGGAYLSGSSAQTVAQCASGAAFVYHQATGGGRFVWSSTDPNAPGNTPAGEQLLAAAFNWLFLKTECSGACCDPANRRLHGDDGDELRRHLAGTGDDLFAQSLHPRAAGDLVRNLHVARYVEWPGLQRHHVNELRSVLRVLDAYRNGDCPPRRKWNDNGRLGQLRP